MKKFYSMFALICVAVIISVAASGCSEAETASENVSTAADNFEVDRRIVFVNGITDKYLLSIRGRCSIFDEGNQLEVTCKVGRERYKKHFLGLSDNVTYFVEQTSDIGVSGYHYKVIFRPQTIIPDIDIRTSGNQVNP